MGGTIFNKKRRRIGTSLGAEHPQIWRDRPTASSTGLLATTKIRESPREAWGAGWRMGVVGAGVAFRIKRQHEGNTIIGVWRADPFSSLLFYIKYLEDK